MATLLTPTNCCPNCNTIFASRTSAIQHLKNAMNKGHCNNNRTHNLQQITCPTNLQCAYCRALGNEDELTYEGIERLHQHIKSSHLPDLLTQSQSMVANMEEEKPRKRIRCSWKKREKKRTRSGELGEPGSSQDCSLHTCKRKKGNNQEEDRDEGKIKKEEDVYSAGKNGQKEKPYG